jgi:hypothetical protein
MLYDTPRFVDETEQPRLFLPSPFVMALEGPHNACFIISRRIDTNIKAY